MFTACYENIKVGKVSYDIRDWSLITRGGATKRQQGHVKFHHDEKGGHNKFLGSFDAVA